MKQNREYKSDVFSMLLEDKKNALEVYNALNNSDYQNPDEVEMIQLEKGVSLSIRNDASFIIDMNLSFYEHQSTYNPNMPLRNLIYFSNSIEDWVKDRELDLYARKQIKIPTPHFVVFYNGLEKRPDVEVMRLSDAFSHETSQPQIEIICTVYNINKGCNKEILEKSKVLRGYMFFVDSVRENHMVKQMELKDAIEKAITECIEKHILESFFRKRKDEVTKMTHLDFTWERREELIRKEEREEGRAEGRAETLRDIIQMWFDKGKTLSEIAMDLDITEEYVQELLK